MRYKTHNTYRYRMPLLLLSSHKCCLYWIGFINIGWPCLVAIRPLPKIALFHRTSQPRLIIIICRYSRLWLTVNSESLIQSRTISLLNWCHRTKADKYSKELNFIACQITRSPHDVAAHSMEVRMKQKSHRRQQHRCRKMRRMSLTCYRPESHWKLSSSITCTILWRPLNGIIFLSRYLYFGVLFKWAYVRFAHNVDNISLARLLLQNPFLFENIANNLI